MLVPEYNPLYGSPVFVVPKKGPKKWRMVVDLRLLNKYSKKAALDLPHLENQLQHIQGAKHFASCDAFSGYDFCPVDKDSQKFFTITTPFGAYKMTGARNSAQYYQVRMTMQVLEPPRPFLPTGDGRLSMA